MNKCFHYQFKTENDQKQLILTPKEEDYGGSLVSYMCVSVREGVCVCVCVCVSSSEAEEQKLPWTDTNPLRHQWQECDTSNTEYTHAALRQSHTLTAHWTHTQHTSHILLNSSTCCSTHRHTYRRNPDELMFACFVSLIKSSITKE